MDLLNSTPRSLRSRTFFRATPTGYRNPLPAWKRTIDLLCVLAALPVLAVLALMAGIVMRFTSPGPIFYTQERVGYRGRRFRLFKFRTMHVNADSRAHQAHLSNLMHSNAPMLKMDSRNDRRLIPGGWLIRACGLDELPQIINVLRGEMSLVGPRPCLPYEYDEYHPWQRERFDAVPGLTGLWQVSGKNRTTFEEMIRFDISYARRISLPLDLKIILRTVPALLTQVGDTQRDRRSMPPFAPSSAKTSGEPEVTRSVRIG